MKRSRLWLLRRFSALAISVVLLLTLAACGGQAPRSAEPGPTPADASTPAAAQPAPAAAPAQPAPAAKPLKIGMIATTSGPVATWGEQDLRGFRLGLEYAPKGTNKVLGRPLELIVEDDGANPGVSVQKARKLVTVDGADILVGPPMSANAIAVMDVAREFQKVHILPNASADAITGGNFSRYSFRTGRAISQEYLLMARYVAENLGKKVVLFGPDTTLIHQASAGFEKALKAFGATEVTVIYAPAELVDFNPYLQRIIDLKPEVLVPMPVGTNWEISLPQQMHQVGIFSRMSVAGTALISGGLKALGDAGIGMVQPVVYYYTLYDNPVNKWLVEEHQKRFNGPPEVFTGQAFAAGIALVRGLEKAGTIEAEGLIAALEGLEFDTAKGPMVIRKEDHQGLQAIPVTKLVKDPKYDHPVPEVIFTVSREAAAPPIAVKR